MISPQRGVCNPGKTVLLAVHPPLPAASSRIASKGGMEDAAVADARTMKVLFMATRSFDRISAKLQYCPRNFNRLRLLMRLKLGPVGGQRRPVNVHNNFLFHLIE
jgi:hypothetical protein